jgi:hypothetical protein
MLEGRHASLVDRDPFIQVPAMITDVYVEAHHPIERIPNDGKFIIPVPKMFILSGIVCSSIVIKPLIEDVAHTSACAFWYVNEDYFKVMGYHASINL